jgi:BirA family biotin operon repressor/biotin-[acetyl-CoA-carboxylase] ligase
MAFKIIHYDIVDSTFQVARNIQDAEEYTTIVAKRQLKGRGRFGREWFSPSGGLWFTTILYPRTPVNTYSLLSLLSSLSVSKALGKITKLKPRIRWPNDVYVNGRKIAGILIESDVNGEIIEKSLIGIGVNVNFKLEHLPIELRDKATTILEECGKPTDEDTLLLEILFTLREYYEKYKRGLYNEIVAEIRREGDFIGSNVILYTRSGKIRTLIRDLDLYGNLIIDLEGRMITLTPKDVEKLEVVKMRESESF